MTSDATPPWVILDQLAVTLQTARSTEELVRPLLELIGTVTGLESTYLTSIDLQAAQQRVEFSRNTGALQIPESLTVDWSDTLCKRALDETTSWCDDVGSRWGDSRAARSLGIETYLSTPIRLNGGELYGTLCGASAAKVMPARESQRLLAIFAHLIGQHIDRERLLQRLHQTNILLERSALEDPLTRLPNRRAMMAALSRHLARRTRDGSGVLVAFIDLDGFKQINDTHGHRAGDRFLSEIAETLTTVLRAGDVVGRLGGDEFLLVASIGEVAPEVAIPALEHRLQVSLCRRFTLGDVELDFSGASIGVVAADLDEDAETLMSRADSAMYAAKRSRRKQCQ